jgi:hypothetical protein
VSGTVRHHDVTSRESFTDVSAGESGDESLQHELGNLVTPTDEFFHEDIPFRGVAVRGPVLVGVRVVGIQDSEVEGKYLGQEQVSVLSQKQRC